jgi:membrane protein YdbS with pleckstrin-like domain
MLLSGDGVTTDLGRSQPAASSDQQTRPSMLRGKWLLIARVGWIVIVMLTLVLSVMGFVIGFHHPALLAQATIRAAVAEAGLPIRLVMFIGLVLPMASFAVTALFIFWRRSDDWMALLFTLTIVMVGAFSTRSLIALRSAYPATGDLVRLLWQLAVVLLVLVLCLFPDGRFVPRWSRLLAVAAIAAAVLLPDLASTFVYFPDEPQGISDLRVSVMVITLCVLQGLGVAAQVYRYRYVSGPVQRQQTKWVVFAPGLLILIFLLAFLLPSLFLDTSNPWFAWALLATVPLFLLFPVGIISAILRYRLYEIDRLINRALVYGMLTATLGTVYAGLVLVLGQLFGEIGTRTPSWVVAGATLAVAALFQPARRHIQWVVDRRFNRRKYNTTQTIEAFSARLRDEIDLDTLSAELLATVDQTMQPTTASLWLRPSVEGPRRTTG